MKLDTTESVLELHDFGPCCACGKTGESVRSILFLEVKAPTPGKGWGCAVCGLAPDGASAVVCDVCLEAGKELKWAIDGYALEKKRVPIEACQEPFLHNLALHQDDDAL